MVSVAPDVLARYVGTYTGVWADRPRTVIVSLSEGKLVSTISPRTDVIPLLPQSGTLFESSEGLAYEFGGDSSGPATHVFEIHVTGNYRLDRQR
jgi:hypothetical protein